jgi:hypothetical protein
VTHERSNEAPSNIVGLNTYMNEKTQRVSPGSIDESWYIARIVDPEGQYVDDYAADILMRVIKVIKQKAGAVKIYATPANADGIQEVDEDDAVVMDGEGFFVERGVERGYMLDAFSRNPRCSGSLAAEMTINQ